MVNAFEDAVAYAKWIGARSLFCAVVFCIAAASLAAGQPQRQDARPAARPNIVWISNEDLSPHLGAYGDGLARTPVLDRFDQGIHSLHARIHDGAVREGKRKDSLGERANFR